MIPASTLSENFTLYEPTWKSLFLTGCFFMEINTWHKACLFLSPNVPGHYVFTYWLGGFQHKYKDWGDTTCQKTHC